MVSATVGGTSVQGRAKDFDLGNELLKGNSMNRRACHGLLPVQATSTPASVSRAMRDREDVFILLASAAAGTYSA